MLNKFIKHYLFGILLALMFVASMQEFFEMYQRIPDVNKIICFIHINIYAVVFLGLFLSIKYISDIYILFKKIKYQYWLILILALMINLFYVQIFIPHNVWTPNNHGISEYAALRDNSFSPLGMLHGSTSEVLLRIISRSLFFLPLDYFSLNYLISILSVLIFFLLVYLLFEREKLALLAAMLLMFLPVHLRLAATESMFVLAELLMFTTLTCFLLFIRSKKRSFFYLGTISLFLLMNTRIELLVLGPMFALILFFIFKRGSILGLLGEKYVLVSILIFTALFVPRIYQILSYPTGGYFSNINIVYNLQKSLSLYHGINPFFNSQVTIPVYVALFIIGLALMIKGNYKIALGLLCMNIFYILFYVNYYGSFACFIGASYLNQFLFIIFIAYGLNYLYEEYAKGKLTKYLFVFSIILLILSAVLYSRPFLTRIYQNQQEFNLLKFINEYLPDTAQVVYLADEDAPEFFKYVDWNYQRMMMNRGGLQKYMSISYFLDNYHKMPKKSQYLYIGTPYYRNVYIKENMKADLVVKRTFEENNKKIVNNFVLKPIKEVLLNNNFMGVPHEKIKKERVILGLYKIIKEKPKIWKKTIN